MVKWSDLPEELWQIIGTFLHSRIDVVRFRSVCSLWRSSRPPFQPPRPPLPPPPPIPLRFSSGGAGAVDPRNQARLVQSTTYRIEKNRSSSSQSEPWLMKLEQDPYSGEMRLVHPVTGSGFRFAMKNVTVKAVQRVVVIPRDFDVYEIFMISNDGNLSFVRTGDEKWTPLSPVDKQNAHFDDIIVYKGRCYVVDKRGAIFRVSSALQVIQFLPPLDEFGDRKYLVECCDDLYVVDQYFRHMDVTRFLDYELPLCRYHIMRSDPETNKFKVFKLDQEWGKWVHVKGLGDGIFILSNDGSFSVSAREFVGVKGNYILFAESSLMVFHSRVFNLEDGRFRSLESSGCSQMVHPPSTWIRR